MSFDFVPRSVKKRKLAAPSVSVGKSIAPSVRIPEAPAEESKEQAPKAAGSSLKEPDLEVLSDLVCLSLSDYALWADVDLRRKIDWRADTRPEDEHGEEGAEGASLNDDAGYIPLAYLLRHSPVFLQASSSPAFTQYPETTYVKALRTHATDSVDVRLVLSSEDGASEKWASSSRRQTGYEVRRKHPATVDRSSPSNYGKADWDKLTIYVENIPIHYRSLTGVLKFMKTLLSSLSTSHPRIQNIAFPRHHRDGPTAIPTCKGFALVTLTSPTDVSSILENWPWDVPHTKRDDNPHKIMQEAAKFGFRVLSKERWELLKAEYLLFRQQLVEEISEAQDMEHAARRRTEATLPPAKPSKSAVASSSHAHPQDAARAQPAAEPAISGIHAHSPYPPGCLVFVRHLHPDTNKTTLRALFGQASAAENTADGIDYVDYMKNMDICHIRLGTPAHAQRLVDYFASHPTRQKDGLDNIGAPSETPESKIIPELVQGKREEVYWEKVPEKVRRQAVDKALKLMRDTDGAATEENKGRNASSGAGPKKRKR